MMVEALKDHGLSACEHAEKVFKSNSIHWIETVPSSFGQKPPQRDSVLGDDSLPKDLFDMNNAWIDMAMLADLGNTDALVGIEEHVVQFDNCTEEPAAILEACQKWGAMPLTFTTGVMFGCDGKPAIQLAALW
jgi:hypothetical protein